MKNFLFNLSIVQFIKKKIIYFKNKKTFNKENFEKTQNNLFLSIDLDRTEGLKKLKKFNQDFHLVITNYQLNKIFYFHLYL